MSETKPEEAGTYYGQLSSGKEWYWAGTGKEDDKWVAIEEQPKEQPKVEEEVAVEPRAIAPGTPIGASTTIDAMFNDVFANRSGTVGSIAYLYSDPVTVMGKYADGSCVLAHLEARAYAPTVITLGAVVAAPGVASVAPSSVAHPGAATPITVTGTGFVSGAVINCAGTDLATTFGSSTSLTATIAAGQLTTAGSLPITVRNPDGQISNAVIFTVT